MRGLVFVVALCVAGCHGSVGPVFAYSQRSGFRIGGELSGGVAFARASLGLTTTPTSAGPIRHYAALEPGFAWRFHPRQPSLDWVGDVLPGLGATLGITNAETPSGVGFAGGFWLSTSHFEDCSAPEGSLLTSVAIGYRWLAGVTEFYVTPKIGTIGGCPTF